MTALKTLRVTIYLILHTAIFAGRAPIELDEKTEVAGQANAMSLNLEEAEIYLRGDDIRLVRFGIPDQSARTRQRQLCGTKSPVLKSAIDELLRFDYGQINVSHMSEHSRVMWSNTATALRILTLCATENAYVRDQIFNSKHYTTLNDNGQRTSTFRTIPKRMAEILKHAINCINAKNDSDMMDTILNAAAAAGEAIWILSFNHAGLLRAFVADGVLESLAEIILRPVASGQERKTSTTTDKNPSESKLLTSEWYHAKMWAAAALQNLAASYCNTDSGHCWWMNNSRNGLHLHPDSKLAIDGEKARMIMIKKKGLINALVDLACQNGHAIEPHTDSNPWPSLSSVYSDHGHSQNRKIVTWAAIGALKNIALSSNAKIRILNRSEAEKYEGKNMIDAVDCLCNALNSPDWLESSKAEDTLDRLGVKCPPAKIPHHLHRKSSYNHMQEDTCIDLWNEDGTEWSTKEWEENCEIYEENETWCEEFGENESEEGVSATEACCICGGGRDNSDGGDEL
eukprot:CAMPEP_0184862142 /NCGR_PEP_ID=MMETSP0580-20130426/6658_1 /TAXON_ID=1118495 /ORGANISM="Dactyliosolen fragilissimus" /LENGTH=512 /DNA_ID=CAMNT_0027359883 /DNA_START=387 /DNA_END=1925 /DNA_ORIENTATION=+